MDSVTLICPPGASDAQISHGATNYRPYLADPRDPESDYHVIVPPHVAEHLLHKGGFALAQVYILQSAGSVRMIARSGASSCSWGGQTFYADEDGAVTVPVEAMADLSPPTHDFVPYNEALAPKHEETPAVAAAAPAKPPRQTAEGGGAAKLPADPEGSPHPDAAPAPVKKPAPEPMAGPVKSEAR
jgi:hypothetical protein